MSAVRSRVMLPAERRERQEANRHLWETYHRRAPTRSCLCLVVRRGAAPFVGRYSLKHEAWELSGPNRSGPSPSTIVHVWPAHPLDQWIPLDELTSRVEAAL